MHIRNLTRIRPVRALDIFEILDVVSAILGIATQIVGLFVDLGAKGETV